MGSLQTREESMLTMKRMTRALAFLLNVIEVYIPVAAFASLFIAFCLQVFFRYVLRDPLRWTFEFSLVSFIWAVMLGACYCLRDNEHIVFTLVHEKMSPGARRAADIFANLFVSVLFGIALVPVLQYIISLSDDFSPVLRIPFSIAFGPFAVMVVDTIIRLVWRTIRELRSIGREV
jgi:TRAP-type C4-dicarboxylate transport system permease small subunit